MGAVEVNGYTIEPAADLSGAYLGRIVFMSAMSRCGENVVHFLGRGMKRVGDG